LIQNIAITGADGFFGRHLVALLTSQGKKVAGVSRQAAPNGVGPDWLTGDLTEELNRLGEFLGRFKPDAVVHLAATSFEPRAATQPGKILHNNLQSTLAVLTACRALNKPPRCVVVSSSAVYGRQAQDGTGIAETFPLNPLTPYGVSKLAVEALTLQHNRAYGLEGIIVRPFNITGPGEHESFVTSAFARQIAMIEAGRQEPIIKVGDLTTSRDFTDVRDAVRALALIAEAGEPGEIYNLCSGAGVPIDELVNNLLEATPATVEVRPDPSLIRPVEIRNQWGDATKLRKATGWKPSYELNETLADVLDDWRARIQFAEAYA
jgi:GDP-4-dehydro-6-deoxy-D-mannose reductase